MAYDTVVADVDRVARIRLDRPDPSNVIGSQGLPEITDAAVDVGRDPEVGGSLLGSTGEVFCASASLQELRELARDRTGRVWASEEFRERAATFLDRGEFEACPFQGTRPREQ